MNDGAAALVVMGADTAKALGIAPLARIVGQATSGLAPKLVLMTPVEAVRKVAKKVGWDLKDVDLFEINEAFSVQMVAVLRELGIDPAKVNVQGGAVALGHPIGASGARVLTTLIYALQRTGRSAASRRCASAAATAWRWRSKFLRLRRCQPKGGIRHGWICSFAPLGGTTDR